MPKHFQNAEHYPSPPRNLIALLFASATIVFELLSGADAIGATNLAHEINQQEQWNVDNVLSAAKLRAQVIAQTPAGYTSEGKLIVDEPEFFGRHESKPTEPMRTAYNAKRQQSRELGMGGLGALFLVGTSVQARRQQRRRNHMAIWAKETQATAGEPPEPRGATALGKMTLGYLPEGSSYTFGKAGEPGHFTILGGMGLKAVREAPHIDIAIHTRVDPVPPTNEIDPAYIGAFEPTVYESSTYDSGIAFLEQEMDRPPELNLWHRIRHRIHTLRAERIANRPVLAPEQRHIVDYSPLPPLDYNPTA